VRSRAQKKDTIGQNNRQRRRRKKIEKVVRKIVPLPGYLLAQKIKCGRPNCKCASGELHGPYFYYVWRVGTRQYKEYVKRSDVAAFRAGIQEHRRRMAEIRAFNQQAKNDWRNLKEKLRQVLAAIKLNKV
jgi:hypothetical protein